MFCSLACFSRPGSHLFLTEGTYWKAASGAAAPERLSAAVAGSAASLAWETVIQRKEGTQHSALSTDESRRSAAHFEALRRTTPSAPTLIFSQPWSTPGRNLKVPHPFQNPSPGGDLAFAGRALRKEPSRAQWFTHSCYLSLHQLASQYHHVTNHLHQQTESCLVGGLGQAPQAWPWANGDKSVVSSAGAWTHLGLLPDGG